MKKLILFILAISISFLSFGQQSNSTKLSGIKLEKEQDFSNIPAYVSFFEDHFIDASKMEQIISYLSKDKLIGIIHLDSADDKLNMTHHRYQQSYNNIPIENTQYIFHTKNNKIESMNGCMLSQPDVSGSFSISESTAFQAALDYIKAEKYIFELGPEKQLPGFANYEVPEAIKVYLPENGDPQSNKIRPAYKFDIYAWKPHSRQWIFVDAETGKVVHTENRLFQGDEEGIAHTAYSGVQAITTHNFGNYYSLMEMSRGNGVYTYNCQMTDDYY
ncbi:MAG: hypothetical protein GX879_00785, partial [Bacteroidales bacterium]|nr:hypothetical protein [Bacteroidales bacterium]